jgi:hypothetical protein
VVASPLLYLPIAFSAELGVLVLLLGYLVGHTIQFFRSFIPDGTTFQRMMTAICDGNPQASPYKTVNEIHQSFVDECWEMFNLSEDYENYGQLFKLLLSYLETRPAKRALRFQAIYSFYRSMVVALVFTGLLGVGVLVLQSQGFVSVESWPGLYGTVGLSILLTAIFYKRKQYFEKEFVRYVVLDFYQDRSQK